MKFKQRQASLDAIAKSITDREIDIKIAKTCLNPVPGEGNPNAKLIFIGEAPGADEDKHGRPFIGASGKFLAEMLNSIGMERQQVYITNIVKFRPPDNRDPRPSEIKACLPVLINQINVIKPSLIVLLGRHAMNVFFPKLKISEAHGEYITSSVKLANSSIISSTFLPLYHPAAALYNGSMRKTLLRDFATIPQILELIN